MDAQEQTFRCNWKVRKANLNHACYSDDFRLCMNVTDNRAPSGGSRNVRRERTFAPCTRIIGLVIGVVFIIPTIGFAQGEYVQTNQSAFAVGPALARGRYVRAAAVTAGFYGGGVDFGVTISRTRSRYYWNRSYSTDLGMRLRGFIMPNRERPILFGSFDCTASLANSSAIFSVGPCLYANAWTGPRSAVQFSFESLFPLTSEADPAGVRGVLLNAGLAFFAPVSQRISIAFETGAEV